MNYVLCLPTLTSKNPLLSPIKHYWEEPRRYVSLRKRWLIWGVRWFGNGTTFHGFFFHRPGNSLKNTCKAVIAWIWHHTCFYDDFVLPIFLWLLFLDQSSTTHFFKKNWIQNQNVNIICVWMNDGSFMYSLFDEKIFWNDKIIKVLLSGAFLKSLSVHMCFCPD